jgi:diamine N-acetyltransferase
MVTHSFRLLAAGMEQIVVIRELAFRIWKEYYPAILHHDQIDYMLARMYDKGVIAAEMTRGVVWKISIRNSEAVSEAVGFMAYEREPRDRRVKLHKLYLLPELHGLGFGRTMIEDVQRDASRWGASHVYLQVNKRNVRAIQAYQRAGFEMGESIVADIGGGYVMDDFLMRWLVRIPKSGSEVE